MKISNITIKNSGELTEKLRCFCHSLSCLRKPSLLFQAKPFPDSPSSHFQGH